MDESENMKRKKDKQASYESSYDVPENYFTELEESLMSHAMHQIKEQKPAKVISMRWLMRAAMFIVILVGGYWMMMDSQYAQEDFYNSEDMVYDYLMEEVDNVTLEDLAELDDIDETIRILEETHDHKTN